MQDRDVQQYCQEVVDKFTREYNEVLDRTIFKMLNHFGFEGKKEDAREWLKNNEYELMMDAEERGDGSYKTIFLLNKKLDKVIAVFMVEMSYENNNPSFRVSDIFVNNNDF